MPGVDAKARQYLPPFAALKAFEAVGTHGGIRRAASILNMDHTTVSRHLRAIETWAGVKLMERTAGTGGCLTAEGKTYHQRISRALVEIAAAGQDLRYREDSHQLCIWCDPGIASEWLAGSLGDFSNRFPKVALELRVSERRPDFVGHEADALLYYRIDYRTHAAQDHLLKGIEIVRPPVLAVASPAFLQDHGDIADPASLSALPLVHEVGTTQWRMWFQAYGLSVEDLSGLKLNQGQLTIAAARKGQGVALANALLVQEQIEAGLLIQIGADWPFVYLGSYILEARADRWRTEPIANFRRWLETKFAKARA